MQGSRSRSLPLSQVELHRNIVLLPLQAEINNGTIDRACLSSLQLKDTHCFPIFDNYRLLNLPKIFQLRLLNSAFDADDKTSSSCLHGHFLFSSSVHQYSTRQASQSDIHVSKTAFNMVKPIRYHGAKLWNTLPLGLL